MIASDRHTSVLLTTALTPMVWGTTYAVTSEFLPPERPLLAGGLRASVAGVILIAIARSLPHGSWWWRSAVLGFFNIGAFFPLLFLAAERLPGGVAATVGAVQPLIAASLGVVLLRDPLRRNIVSGGFVGIVGVGCIVLVPSARLDGIGVAAALASAVSMATGVVLAKKWRPLAGNVSDVAFTAWQLLPAGIGLMIAVPVTEGLPASLTGRNLAGYAWLGIVGGALAYVNWFRGIRRLPVANAAILSLLSPVVATVIGVAILDQPLRGTQPLGIALVLLALWLARPRPAAPDRSEPPSTANSSRG